MFVFFLKNCCHVRWLITQRLRPNPFPHTPTAPLSIYVWSDSSVKCAPGRMSGLNTAAQWSVTKCVSTAVATDYSCGCDKSHTSTIHRAGCNDHVACESFHSYVNSIWLMAQVAAFILTCDDANNYAIVQMLFEVTLMEEWKTKLLSTSVDSQCCFTMPLNALFGPKRTTFFLPSFLPSSCLPSFLY